MYIEFLALFERAFSVTCRAGILLLPARHFTLQLEPVLVRLGLAELDQVTTLVLCIVL